MNPLRLGGSMFGFDAREFRLPNFEISWVGECPWNQGMCFGSEDGRIRISERDDPSSGTEYPISASGEAINGVAFVDDQMAASTRSDVSFLQVHQPWEGKVVGSTRFDGGAHGVVATSFKTFVAPLGPNGLLLMEPRVGDRQYIRPIKAEGKNFNFYKCINLGSSDQGEVLVCAARRDGLATAVQSPPNAQSPRDIRGFIRSLNFPGLDIIDVCSLGSTDFPFAAAALGIDSSLLLSRDVLGDRNPVSLRFDGMEGVAYRILSAHGQIFVLTSQYLYKIQDFASNFLGGQRLDVSTKVRGIPIQAVDVNIGFGGCLFIVMPDSVFLVNLDTMDASVEGTASPLPFGKGINLLCSPSLMRSACEFGSRFELGSAA